MSREMKESGIPGTGLIPTSWKTARIKQLVSGLTDGTHGTYERVFEGSPLLSAKNVFPDGLHISENESLISYEDYLSIVKNGFPQKGDLLLCCVGTIGRCAIYDLDEPMAFQRSVIFMRPNGLVGTRFMYYMMSCDSMLSQEGLYVNQAAQAGLYQGAVRELSVAYPDFPEQDAIVSYLDDACAKIDEAISRHKQIIEKLEEYRKSVITKAVTKGLKFNTETKESHFLYAPKIPKNWRIVNVKNIVDNDHPYPLGDGDHGLIKADSYVDSGIPFLRVQNLSFGEGLQLNNLVYITEEQNKSIRNSTLRPNDILFAKTGATIGKTGIVPDNMPIANTTSHVGKLTASKKYCPKYVYYVLSSDIGYSQFWEVAEKKSTRPEVSIEEMKSIKITVPPLEEQHQIVLYLDDICKKLNNSRQNHELAITKLEEYRKSIIYNAVTGKIDCRR